MNRQTLTIGLIAGALAYSAVPAGAGPVQVSTRTEADGSQTMVHEALVDAAIADLWTAISTPQGWTTWAVPVAWLSPGNPDILETSYDLADRPGSPTTIQQRFVARIPGRLLAFRTIKAPVGFPNWESYQNVTSIFELETAGRRTRVRLTSVGYPDTTAGRALIRFFQQGNTRALESLKQRFVKGPVDWTKR